jgi:hypothetical protein
MTSRIPDFRKRALETQARLGSEGAARLLEAGRAWDLAPVLSAGGAVVFPHLSLPVCGHYTAAAVHACLDSGAARVVVLGVLHALTDELEDARVRVAAGGDPSLEPSWGIQGPGSHEAVEGARDRATLVRPRDDWTREFSLMGFLFLWREELARRGAEGPELVVRYPYLAGGAPEDMPGMRELETLASGGVIVATADPFHHGIGYGDAAIDALPPDERGLELARSRIDEGLDLLRRGDYWGYNQHCVSAKSDARDVGQVTRHLAGPVDGAVLDLLAEDMSGPYGAPVPTWVAGALITLTPRKTSAT